MKIFVPSTLALLATTFTSATIAAQTVAAVSGEVVTLSFGSAQGVAVGMTGRICTDEEVGGRKVEVCDAKLEVTTVSPSSSTAKITAGDASQVARGYRVKLDRREGAALGASSAGRGSLTSAGSEAEVAFWNSVKDTREPAELMLFLKKFPAGVFAELARARLARLEGTAGSQPTADSRPAAPAPATWSDPRLGLVFRRVPAGEFTMGCTAGDLACSPDEEPSILVTLPASFYMAVTETTVGQYRRFASATGRSLPPAPSFVQAEDHPVVNVTWQEAKVFCEWVGGRLPTEAEWEYAARGGLAGAKYPWGNDEPTCAEGARNGARFSACESGTATVQSFAANGYGLYDMAGNAWEWVADRYEGAALSSSPKVDSHGPEPGSLHVIRGGTWSIGSWGLRVSYRSYFAPDTRYGSLSFRCARGGIS